MMEANYGGLASACDLTVSQQRCASEIPVATEDEATPKGTPEKDVPRQAAGRQVS